MNSKRLRRFAYMLYEIRCCSHNALVAIVQARSHYSPLYRAAALRHLVVDAPLEVTGGRPYAERRRNVRRHYGI